MRQASRALRDVQLKRLYPNPQVSSLLRRLRLCPNGTRCGAFITSCDARAFSTFWKPVSAVDYDLILPELSHAFGASIETSTGVEPTAWSSLVLESSIFQKWHGLLADSSRLAVESDFFREGPAEHWYPKLLVDWYLHKGDLALWACLLDYQMRINGPKGVIHVWKGLWGRKTLHDVEGPLAEMFWRVILEGALASDDLTFLEQIWVYSEWMFEMHRVRWPHLYTTVIKHFLRTHQHQRVLQWQLLLAPNFYPGAVEFADVIKEFALDHELYHMDTLPSLYRINRDKDLYNTLVPHLFNFGASNLARKWRNICLENGEEPREPAPLKPFLRFLKAYFPGDELTRIELAALNFAAEPKRTEVRLSRDFLNRVQGETFGISVKDYNDQLGARWFASTWVSLDTAISTISALGIEKIGPLSFQSIALRAANSEELLKRIAQLREHGISVEDSNYYHLMLYLASEKDDELLKDLLNSDLHPDVFNDFDLQTRLINSSVDVVNWRTQRLLLVARLATFQRSSREMTNNILRLRFRQRDPDGVTQVLEDMKTWHVPLNFQEAEFIFQGLIDDYNNEGRRLTTPSATFYLAIFRQLKSMDVPVPLSHWRLIIINMARQGRIEDLGRLCMELADLFLHSTSMRPGFVPVHMSDLPEPAVSPLKNIENLFGVYIPQDMPTNVDHHPLRNLFNSKLLTEIIENAFAVHSGPGIHVSPGIKPQSHRTQATQVASMIKIFRALRKRGTWFRFRKIRFVVTNCLTNIYGPSPSTDSLHRSMRKHNTLMLADMKKLIDNAWGEKLLPPLRQLTEIVQRRSPYATLDSRPQEIKELDRRKDDEDDLD